MRAPDAGRLVQLADADDLAAHGAAFAAAPFDDEFFDSRCHVSPDPSPARETGTQSVDARACADPLRVGERAALLVLQITCGNFGPRVDVGAGLPRVARRTRVTPSTRGDIKAAMAADTYDYIIVGAGTAGCLLANRLSADADAARAAAGGRRQGQLPLDPYPRRLPVSAWATRARTGAYRTADEPGLNGRSLDYPRGRVMGGCSSINGMIYMRGQARDYDLWRQHGQCRLGLGRRAALLQEAPRTSGRWSPAPTACMARGGEWRVEQRASAGICWMRFARRRHKLASPRSTISTAATTRAAAISRSTRRRGMRWNTSKAFLAPCAHRRNLRGRDATPRSSGSMLDGKRVHRRSRAPARRSRALSRPPRGDPGGRRHRLAADHAAVRHRPAARCCSRSGSR